MLAKVLSASFFGVEGYLIDVEVDISNGLPMFNIVGLGDIAISESKERVRASIKNSGFDFAPKRVVVNLSPAHIRKEGSSFDLAIALGILTAYGHINDENIKNYIEDQNNLHSYGTRMDETHVSLPKTELPKDLKCIAEDFNELIS